MLYTHNMKIVDIVGVVRKGVLGETMIAFGYHNIAENLARPLQLDSAIAILLEFETVEALIIVRCLLHWVVAKCLS
jgi:hypothetical protein